MAEVASLRSIKVLVESGGAPQSINSDASTWGELKDQLSAQGVRVSGMSAIDGGTNTEFVASNSVLPTGNFTLFLIGDHRVKSGGILEDILEKVTSIEALVREHIANTYTLQTDTTNLEAGLKSAAEPVDPDVLRMQALASQLRSPSVPQPIEEEDYEDDSWNYDDEDDY